MRKALNQKSLTFSILGLFLLYVLPWPMLAVEENLGILRGFIYKSDNKTPIWGSQVIIQDIKTGQILESNVTDSTGDYKIEHVPPGDYKLLIWTKDRPYKTKKIDFLVKILAGKTTTLSFALKRSVLPFFLQPCGMAVLIAGTALGVAIGKKPPEEPPQSPTER